MARFLFCLPLRLGVFIISFLQFLACGAFAGLLWWALIAESRDAITEFTKNMRVTVIFVASIYTAVALFGLIGFLGAVFRQNRFIKTYYIMLCFATGFQFAAGIWYLVSFYRTRGRTLADCLDGSTDYSRVAYCKSLEAYKFVPQGYIIAHVVVPLVIQLYACYIVNRYARYLDTEKIREAPFLKVAPVYQRVNPQDESYPLSHPNMTYPYADGPNSFGNKV